MYRMNQSFIVEALRESALARGGRDSGRALRLGMMVSLFALPTLGQVDLNNIIPPRINTYVFPTHESQDEAGTSITVLHFGQNATFIAHAENSVDSSVNWDYLATGGSKGEEIWKEKWGSGRVCTNGFIVKAEYAAQKGWQNLGAGASATARNQYLSVGTSVTPPIPVTCGEECGSGTCSITPPGTAKIVAGGRDPQVQMSLGRSGGNSGTIGMAIGLNGPEFVIADPNMDSCSESGKLNNGLTNQVTVPGGVFECATDPVTGKKTITFTSQDSSASSSWVSIERIALNPPQGDANYKHVIKSSNGETVEATPAGYGQSYYPAAGTPPELKSRWNVVRISNETLVKKTEIVRELNGLVDTERFKVINLDGTSVVASAETRTTYTVGYEAVAERQLVRDPDGISDTHHYEYYTDPTETNTFQKTKQHTYPDGAWTKFEYDSSGRLSVERSGWLDASAGGESQRTVYSYEAVDPADDGTNPDHPRTVVQYVGDQEVARTYTSMRTVTGQGANSQLVTVTARASASGATFADTTNERTVRTTWGREAPNAPGAGDPHSVLYPDGRIETHTYEIGEFDGNTRTFTANSSGSHERQTRTEGTQANPEGVENRTLRHVEIRHLYGDVVIYEETDVRTGVGYAVLEWAQHVTDPYWRRISTTRSNGTVEEITHGCCGIEARVAADGTEEGYEYDALHRLTETTRYGAPSGSGAPTVSRSVSHVYDDAGRMIQTLTQAGSLSQTNQTVYDTAGRVVQTVDEQGRVTSYGYAADGLSQTVTNANGSVVETARYRDGRSKHTMLNGDYRQVYAYGVESDGRQRTTVYSGPGGANSPVWQKTWTDMLGRTVRTERPAHGGGVLVQTSEYDALGRLVRSTSTGQPDTLYSYDTLSELFHTAHDLNSNGAIDLASDRVQSSYTFYQALGSDWWRVSAGVIYPQANSATPLTNSISRTRLTGLGGSGTHGLLTSEQVSLDLLGNATTSQVWTDRAAKKITQVTTTPTSATPAVQVTVNGVTVSSASPTGVAMTYSYDALSRQIQALRSGDRPVAQKTAYDSLGRVVWVEDGATNRTAFAYDSVGRQIAVSNALGQVTHTAYDNEDRVLATWGATYPVAYEFDAFGRMTAMYTYRGTSEISALQDFNLSAFDKTQWRYDTASGALTNKLYSDGKGPSYTYTADGKLATRTWARGVVTSYGYDSTGNLLTVTYSDDTPSFTNTHDRLGRVVTVTDAQGTRTNVYSASTLTLIEEHLPDGTVLTRSQDTFGRPSGLTVAEVGDLGDPPYSVAYAYDASSRFVAVTSTVAGATNTYAYSYLPGADLLVSVSNNLGQVAARSWETHRDLITSVENTFGTNRISRFDYTNDTLARRTRRVDNQAVTNDFGYNLRSEVIEALMGTNTYGYAYDPIGNRLAATNNAEALSYVANELNQYTSISNGVTLEPSYDDDGNLVAYGDWTFTWNGENRLVAAQQGKQCQVAFAYDYMGRRVSKVTEDGSGTTECDYVYDGWALIRERIASGETAQTNSYVYGLDLSGSLQGAGTIAGILATVREGDSAPVVGFYAYDANGNVTDLVGTNGTGLAHYEYDPFGNVILMTGPAARNNPFRFSTKHTDNDTGLVCYGFRYYSPTLGRWLSRDPIDEAGGLLLYGAMFNDPVNRMDYQGLISWWECSGYCASYHLKQMMNAIAAIEALVVTAEGMMELPISEKVINSGTERLTSLGNKIFQRINSATGSSRMPSAVKSALQQVAQWAKTSGTMKDLPGLRSKVDAVRRFAKGGRTVLRMARGGVVAGAAIAVGIESYCMTACCWQDVREDYENRMNTSPEDFLGGGSGDEGE